MKHLTKLSSLLALLFLVLTSCSDDDEVKPSNLKDFQSFKFLASQNPGLATDVNGVITDNTVTLKVNNAADITKLVPTFETMNQRTIVSVNNVAQVSGVTEQNFTQPVSYVVTAEDNSTKTYTVTVVRNAAIVSFGFFAEDNPGVLFKDYVGTVTGVNVAVDLPSDANLAQLVARFQTTDGATVKVGGTTQTSGQTANNFTNAVTYTVSDSEGSENYTVTVGRLTAPQWLLIGTEAMITPRTDGLVMAINPATNMPYLAFQIDGTGYVDADKKAAVIKYDGTGSSWSFVGPATGFSGTRAEYVSLAFASNGTPYVAYKDYTDNLQAMTVETFSNGNWSVVGSKNFSNKADNYVSLGLDKDNVPYVSFSDRSNVSLPNRGLNVYSYKSGAWTSAPPAGVTTSTTQLLFKYDNLYLAIMERTVLPNKPTVFKLQNNTWSPVGTPMFSANENGGNIKVDLDVASDGTMYLAYQDATTSGQRVNYVMKYNGSTWAAIGDPINVLGERDNFNIAVHPDGRLFFAYVDATGLNVRIFNNTTNNWGSPIVVDSRGINEFDLQISEVGIPYIAASIEENDKTMVWKYDIP